LVHHKTVRCRLHGNLVRPSIHYHHLNPHFYFAVFELMQPPIGT
jgi:hypothetical protein